MPIDVFNARRASILPVAARKPSTNFCAYAYLRNDYFRWPSFIYLMAADDAFSAHLRRREAVAAISTRRMMIYARRSNDIARIPLGHARRADARPPASRAARRLPRH